MDAKKSILKHIGLAGVLEGCGVYDNVITAMEDYAREQVKNSQQALVSGQSELLLAFLQYLDEKNKAAWITHKGIVNQFLSKQ